MSLPEAPSRSSRASAAGRQSLHFLTFGLSGLPAFVVALGLNKFLVDVAHWPKPIAYLPVVWMQMNVGFLMCHFFVFRSSEPRPLPKAYWQYILSMWTIRGADWLLYTLLVETLHVPFLLAQVCTSGTLLVVKFISAKAIFKTPAEKPATQFQENTRP